MLLIMSFPAPAINLSPWVPLPVCCCLILHNGNCWYCRCTMGMFVTALVLVSPRAGAVTGADWDHCHWPQRSRAATSPPAHNLLCATTPSTQHPDSRLYLVEVTGLTRYFGQLDKLFSTVCTCLWTSMRMPGALDVWIFRSGAIRRYLIFSKGPTRL